MVGVAGGRPHRGGQRAAQHVLHQRRAGRAAAGRRRRGAPGGAVVPVPRLRRPPCRAGIPGLDLAAPPPLLAEAVPSLRRIAFDLERPARRSTPAGPWPGCWPAPTRSATTCWPRPRPPSRPADRDGDRAHLGLDQRAQGRDPRPRPADPPPRQPQRAAPLRRRRGAVLQLAVLLDRRASPTPCSARSWPAPRSSARTPPTAAGVLDVLERERPTMVNGFAAVGRPPARGPDLRRPRPVVDPPRQPLPDHAGRRSARPTPSCATACSA